MPTLPLSSANDLLAELLKMHEADQPLERSFVEANAEGLARLFEQGLSCYSVTRAQAGNIRFRPEHEGVLTPKGLLLARQN